MLRSPIGAPRFYVAEIAAELVPGRDVALPESAAHHAAKVLRLRVGDAVTLFTGHGGEFAATIAHIDRHRVAARIDAFEERERESSLHATLVQAIAANDAMEYAIRKSVELGATAIQPVITTRSAPLPAAPRATQRQERWRNIAIAACEQCGRNRLPEVRYAMPLDAWLQTRTVEATGIVPAPGAVRSLAEIAPPQALDVLIGPEGGLTAAELALAESAGMTPLHLGPRVLRTETAGPAVLAAVQALWGDWR
ncbi:MAG TPA: 16S rRNA (uracil(1498)-N(3))-methyltransferase [Casimicrobiaceae bacterium]|nr:16S rRNA (uracil(1498)-N(3))-methyltransferase [Casimicrobiaceae bacterium]